MNSFIRDTVTHTHLLCLCLTLTSSLHLCGCRALCWALAFFSKGLSNVLYLETKFIHINTSTLLSITVYKASFSLQILFLQVSLLLLPVGFSSQLSVRYFKNNSEHLPSI